MKQKRAEDTINKTRQQEIQEIEEIDLFNVPSVLLLVPRDKTGHSYLTSNQVEYEGEIWLPSKAACLLRSKTR